MSKQTSAPTADNPFSTPFNRVQITLQKHQSQDRRWGERAKYIKRHLLDDKKVDEAAEIEPPGQDSIFDLKFCPFLPEGAAPIFAFTSGPNVFVCRLNADAENPFEVINAIEDEDEGRNNKTWTMDSYQLHNSIAWMREPGTGDPLLLFSGTVPKIQVYNVAKKEYSKTLTGHGSGVQEIVPHPTLPYMFATCSDDNEVRIWNLDSKFEDSWCSVICHGEFGHTATIYSIAFTHNGRYLISGGRDTWIHMWALPPPEELTQLPVEKAKSKRIYYPHFSSADVHADIIDCVRFYGDLIFSRCVGYKITCWRIDGFSSEDPVPDPPTKQTIGKRTRSAFGTGFMILYTFNHMLGPTQAIYYHRFSIFPGLNGRPVLVMGDLGNTTLRFWDLQKLEGDEEESGFNGHPLEMLEPDYTVRLAAKRISFYRVAEFSPDGKWLVAAYDHGNLFVCWR